MAQSATLAEFFDRFGGLQDIANEIFPVSLGRHSLQIGGFSLEPDPETGDDTLLAVFNLVEHDSTNTTIVGIVEQRVGLLALAPAVADDVYRVREIRIWIDPEVVKTRLKRFLQGLARSAKSRYPAVKDAPDLRPSSLI